MQAIEAKHGLKAYDAAKGNKEAIYELVRCRCSLNAILLGCNSRVLSRLINQR